MQGVLVSDIQIERNSEDGPAWVASGKVGDSSFYGGSDDLDELKQWIAEAEAEEAAGSVEYQSPVRPASRIMGA